jgi:phage-related protein
MAFPTLTENGVEVRPSYPITERNEDSVIRSDFEGGYVQTRARYTRVRKIWQISYNLLSTTNKNLISAFVDTVQGGADSFTWTNPIDSANYQVRFQAPPTYSHTQYERWDVKFTLEQV